MYAKDFIVYNPDRFHSVVVTGSWCGWSEQGHSLTKIPGLYWICTVELPFSTKIQYKYIIDGQWQTLSDDETETGSDGNTNNVFNVPAEEALQGPVVGSTGSTQQEPIIASSTSSGSLGGFGGAAPDFSSTSGTQDRDQPASHELADSGVAAAAAKAASSAGLGHDEHERSQATSAGPASSGTGLNHVPTGGNVAATGVAAEAARAAEKAGLGHDEHERSTATSAGPASASSGLNHVPTGGSAAQSGVAAEAAREAQKHGLGHAEGETGGAVQGMEKVAPGVVQATSGSSDVAGMTDSDLAAPEGLSSTPGSSTRAPLPASTGDAPLAPESAHHAEGKGLFGVLGGLGAAAIGAATAAASNVAHMVTDDHSTTGTAASSHASKDPAAALAPIASTDATSKISRDFAAVDLSHTRQEVVNVVERFGGALAGGLAGLGNMAGTGRLEDTPTTGDSAWAKERPSMSVSAFGNSAKRNSIDASANVVDFKLPKLNNLLPASLVPSFAAPDAQRMAAHTGGLAAATPSGSVANTPAISGGPPGAFPVSSGLTGTMNNAAGAAGSSATLREASPARDSSSAQAVASSTGSTSGSTSAVPGLDIQKSGTTSSSSAADVPGLSINGSSPAAAAATTASRSGESMVPGLNIEKTGSTSARSAPEVPGLSINGSSPTGTSQAAAATSKPTPIHEGTTTGTKPAVGRDDNAASSAGRALGEDAPSAAHVAPTAPAPAPASASTTSTPAATPVNSISKKDTSALGKGQPGAAPVTPKKSAAGTSNLDTPATDGYKTAPSTPASQAGTPADRDRKRKSSIFNKIKSAFSPSK